METTKTLSRQESRSEADLNPGRAGVLTTRPRHSLALNGDKQLSVLSRLTKLCRSVQKYFRVDRHTCERDDTMAQLFLFLYKLGLKADV
jgi:hypothetical protein